MSGLVAIVGDTTRYRNLESVEKCLNPLGAMHSELLQSDDVTLMVVQHPQAPSRHSCFIDNDEFALAIAGDVVNHGEIDWFELSENLVTGRPNCRQLRTLRGAFSLTLVDKISRCLFVVTDPFAWQPVYMYVSDDGVMVSTTLATFLRSAATPPSVDVDWIYEFMYFNYGVGPTTPLVGVRRLPPATVSRYELDERKTSQREYRDKPSSPATLLAGRAADKEVIDLFGSVVPAYFPADSSTTMALSAGLDCRAILAAVPDHSLDCMHSFTFGMPDSSEFVECDDIAARLGFTHQPIALGEEFQYELPQLARDTVFLSSGLQNVNRSHLLYVYSRLQHEGEPFSLMATGVSGDHIFRDHMRGRGNIPHIVSAAMAAQFREGRHTLAADPYEKMFGQHFAEFRERIEASLDAVADEYGEYEDPYTYLAYLMYEAGPRYFGGQLAIANSFTTFRTPYWDPDVVELGFRLQDATLGFSASMNAKDEYRETRVQAAIVAASRRIAPLPYRDLPISAYANGNKLIYQLYRGQRRLRATLRWRQYTYGEDWSQWYRTVMYDEVVRLLGDESRLRDYVSVEFIESAIASSDIHWLGKLVTAEHVLRLAEAGWQQTTENE